MLFQLIKLTKQLIRCQSVNQNDAGCQKLITSYLLSLGFNIEHMNFGEKKNFWAWRGYGKTLVFSGHTDVALAGNLDHWKTHPFNPVIRNGILFGRGAADMKGAIASMLIATKRFIKKNPNHQGRLAFLITSDEEGDGENSTSKIVKKLMLRKEQIDYCLIGEPSSTKIIGDVIKYGRRGSLTCNLIIYGIQGHVAYNNLIDNPIHKAIFVLKELISTNWDNGNDFFPPTSIQITNINAGVGSSNTTPMNISMQFNFRFNNELNDELIKDYVITILKKYRIKYTVNWFLSAQPFVSKIGKLVHVTINSILKYSKIFPKLLTTGGTSDGRFIVQMGAQIVELGTVNSTIHKANECVNIADLQLLVYIYQSIIEQMIR